MKLTQQQYKIIIERLITLLFKTKDSSFISRYLKLFFQMRKDNGLAYTIKYYKAVKLHITRYMCHKPLMCNNANVSVSKDGFPTRFEFLRPLVKENPKALLTLLSFTRSVEPQKNEKAARVVNLSTITAPYKGIEYTIPKAFIKSFIDKYDLSSSKHEYSAKDHYLSIKGSPNGKASVSSL